MIISGHMVVEEAPGRAGLGRGAIRIQGERIAEVLSADAAGAELGGDDCVISPGFVDAHLHIPQFDSIGRGGMTLLRWLDAVVFPAEARWADAGFAAAMARRAGSQLLAHGTTAIAAYGTVHHEGTMAAMRALAEMHLTGVVGQVLMDRGAPDALVRPAGQLLEEAARMAPVGRLRPAVTPRFAISCSPELLAGAGSLAAARDWPVQTHLAETVPECERVRELFGAASYTEVYRAAGLLRHGALLGHGIHLSEGERRMIAQAGAVVAHCPTANSFLRSGDMDLAGHRESGVRVALGSDIAGGYERSMVRVGRAALETAARRNPEDPGPGAAWAWWQITAGNAGAIGLGRGGRLEAGAPADVVVIRPDIAWRESADPLGTLMHAWDDRWIIATVAGGRVAYAAA